MTFPDQIPDQTDHGRPDSAVPDQTGERSGNDGCKEVRHGAADR